jgi:hypothetical protein
MGSVDGLLRNRTKLFRSRFKYDLPVAAAGLGIGIAVGRYSGGYCIVSGIFGAVFVIPVWRWLRGGESNP